MTVRELLAERMRLAEELVKMENTARRMDAEDRASLVFVGAYEVLDWMVSGTKDKSIFDTRPSSADLTFEALRTSWRTEMTKSAKLLDITLASPRIS